MERITKVLMTKEGRRFFIRGDEDCHSQFGAVRKEDIAAAKDGTRLPTNTGKEMFLYSPFFRDLYSRIKRGAQIIPLKDIAAIVAETGIGKGSRVVDAGAGTGALACFLALLAKEVVTYDIRDDFIAIVGENIAFLQLDNITVKNKDIYGGIDEEDVDTITLDVPEPWKALPHAAAALKAGGFLVSYSPSITQTADFTNAVLDNPRFAHIKTFEIIEREWEISARKVRPVTAAIGHSGFITIARKLQ